MATLVALYKKPADAAAFDRYYFATHTAGSLTHGVSLSTFASRREQPAHGERRVRSRATPSSVIAEAT